MTHLENDMVFSTDRWSRYQWERFIEESDQGTQLLDQVSTSVYSAPRFAREVFARLFSGDPARVDKMRPEDAWSELAHDNLSELPDFARLQKRCYADRFLAGETALTLTKRVMDDLPPPPAPLTDPERLRQQVKGLLSFASPDEPFDETVATIQADGKAAVENAIAFANAIDPSALRQGFRAACQNSEDHLGEFDDQLDAFANWQSFDSPAPSVKAQLASRIRKDAKLKHLAEQAGRLRRIAAHKQRTRVDQSRNEINDIELGADLDRLLPTELLKLADPIQAQLFARAFCERSLLQYRLHGKEQLGRGPLVVCVDQSGSMEGPKEIWSKGMAIALIQVALSQNRKCRVIHFDSRVRQVDDFNTKNVDPLALIESMEPFFSGGTNFERPLNAALNAISRDPDMKRADIVFITDAEAHVETGFLERWRIEKNRLNFSVYGVHVDAPGCIVPEILEEIADQTVGISDLAHDEIATDLLLSI